MKTKRAAILARVSTGSQDSLRQTSELQELAKNKGYLVEAEDIYEDTISGLKTTRTVQHFPGYLITSKRGRRNMTWCSSMRCPVFHADLMMVKKYYWSSMTWEFPYM